MWRWNTWAVIEVLLGFGFVWIFKKSYECSIKNENQMKFSFCQNTAATCGQHLQGTVTGHWVIDLSKRRQNYFCGNWILKLNIAGRHVTYPAITGICDPLLCPLCHRNPLSQLLSLKEMTAQIHCCLRSHRLIVADLHERWIWITDLSLLWRALKGMIDYLLH